MRLLNFANFEMPAAFSRIFDRGNSGQPPKMEQGETRYVSDALNHPVFNLYNPEALHFPRAQLPVVPANGNITMGMMMPEYDNQAIWDRTAPCQAGPVREFFRGVLFDNRIKHL